jgi:hypothetical protein
LKGEITIITPGEIVWRGKFKARRDGKPKGFKAKSEFRWMGNKGIEFKVRTKSPDSLVVEAKIDRTDSQAPIIFNLSGPFLIGQEKYAQGRGTNGRFTEWKCLLKVDKL